MMPGILDTSFQLRSLRCATEPSSLCTTLLSVGLVWTLRLSLLKCFSSSGHDLSWAHSNALCEMMWFKQRWAKDIPASTNGIFTGTHCHHQEEREDTAGTVTVVAGDVEEGERQKPRTGKHK